MLTCRVDAGPLPCRGNPARLKATRCNCVSVCSITHVNPAHTERCRQRNCSERDQRCASCKWDQPRCGCRPDLLSDQRHREALIEHPQLALRRLRIRLRTPALSHGLAETPPSPQRQDSRRCILQLPVVCVVRWRHPAESKWFGWHTGYMKMPPYSCTHTHSPQADSHQYRAHLTFRSRRRRVRRREWTEGTERRESL